MAMELIRCDLAVGSEGSFGAHPGVFFAAADDEILLLYDKKNELEIVVREISTDTNFSAAPVETEKQLLDFAQRAKFPSHALIIKKAKTIAAKWLRASPAGINWWLCFMI
jgi:hypothetical protein